MLVASNFPLFLAIPTLWSSSTSSSSSSSPSSLSSTTTSASSSFFFFCHQRIFLFSICSLTVNERVDDSSIPSFTERVFSNLFFLLLFLLLVFFFSVSLSIVVALSPYVRSDTQTKQQQYFLDHHHFLSSIYKHNFLVSSKIHIDLDICFHMSKNPIRRDKCNAHSIG